MKIVSHLLKVSIFTQVCPTKFIGSAFRQAGIITQLKREIKICNPEPILSHCVNSTITIDLKGMI